jgi:hypothetical protein
VFLAVAVVAPIVLTAVLGEFVIALMDDMGRVF